MPPPRGQCSLRLLRAQRIHQSSEYRGQNKPTEAPTEESTQRRRTADRRRGHCWARKASRQARILSDFGFQLTTARCYLPLCSCVDKYIGDFAPADHSMRVRLPEPQICVKRRAWHTASRVLRSLVQLPYCLNSCLNRQGFGDHV